MRCDDLQMLYRHLRRELDAAYAARPWDGARIDRIAEDLLHLERTLVARQGVLPRLAAAPRPQRITPAPAATRS